MMNGGRSGVASDLLNWGEPTYLKISGYGNVSSLNAMVPDRYNNVRLATSGAEERERKLTSTKPKELKLSSALRAAACGSAPGTTGRAAQDASGSDDRKLTVAVETREPFATYSRQSKSSALAKNASSHSPARHIQHKKKKVRGVAPFVTHIRHPAHLGNLRSSPPVRKASTSIL